MLRRCLSLVTLLVMTAGLAWNQGINTQANKNDWEEINFDFDSAVLVDGFPSLLRLAELLQANPGAKVKIEGYTDILGTEAYNVKLGQSRADAVRDFLVKYGARATQIATSSRGEASPKVAAQGDSYKKTDEGRYMNRRVVLTVTDAQGNPIAAGGAGDAIRAINQQTQQMQECCDQILKRLDKLDDIAKMLRDLADQNAALKRDLDAMKDNQAAMQRALDAQGARGAGAQGGAAGAPGPQGPQGPAGAGAGVGAGGGQSAAAAGPSADDIAKKVLDQLNKEKAGKGKNFQLMGLNVGSDDRKNISASGRGRYFKPFGDNFGFQAQGEYYYIRGQREGQFDFGLVDRFNKRVQAGLFASFKSVSLTGNQTSGTVGQASFVADYFFGRGKVSLFGTKAFKDNALINRANGIGANGELQRNIILERYLKVVDQVGVGGAISLMGNTYAEGNIAYLRSTASSNRAGGTLRFVMPMNDKVAFTVEGGVNETLLPVKGTQQGRAAVGVQLGNFLRPKEYLAADHAIAMEVPRVRYELLTKRVRIGNDPPVVDAGPDQINVNPGTIILDGSNTYDPDGDPITYQWVQEVGPQVSVNNATSAKASFSAAAGQSYVFRLTAKDNQGGQSSARARVTTTQGDRAQIVFFQTDKTQVNQGQTATLSWRVINADTVTLNGQTVAAQGSVPVTPNTTTTYTLSAKNKINEDTATQTVVVIGARFQYCYATPANISAGGSATLNWSAPGATSVTISPLVAGALLPATGSVVVKPERDTTYVLSAIGGGQTDRCTIAVTVGSGSGNSAVPTISRFSADPTSIDPGQNSTLTWNVSNADRVSISSIGTVNASGTRSVSPNQTTTYVLTASNSAGTATAQATVTVSTVVAPKILSFTASPATFSTPGQKIELTCRTSGAQRVQIAQATYFTADATFPVFPTVETTYACIATNANGQAVTQNLTVKPTPAPDPGPKGQPPVIVVAGGNFRQSLTRTVFLDASGSSSPSGNNPLTYKWTSDDPIWISDSTIANPVVGLDYRLQVYTLKLTVTDSKGNSTTQLVQIEYVGADRR